MSRGHAKRIRAVLAEVRAIGDEAASENDGDTMEEMLRIGNALERALLTPAERRAETLAVFHAMMEDHALSYAVPDVLHALRWADRVTTGDGGRGAEMHLVPKRRRA